MLWIERIAVCVDTEMKTSGKTRQDVAKMADVSAATVDAVRHGRLGTGADSIDAVVRALGMMVIADCIQSVNGGLAAEYEVEAALLRERADRVDAAELKVIREMFGMCHLFADLGLAAEAVRVWNRWRAGLEQPDEQPQLPIGRASL